MFETLHCIALRTVRHNDKLNMLSAWTAERGRVSFALSASNGREAARRRALTMPLMMFDCECDFRSDREVQKIGDLTISSVGTMGLTGLKAPIAQWLSAVLDQVLRMQQPDMALDVFLRDALLVLDASHGRSLANFPVYFLYNLCRFLGLGYDSESLRPGRVFDIREGRFVSTPPMHGQYIEWEEARVIPLLGRMKPCNLGAFAFTRFQRRLILSGISDYLCWHLSLRKLGADFDWLI